MPKTMKAAVVEKVGGPLVMKELPIPAPGPGQVLMQVISSGVCHTDLHAVDGDWPVKPSLPFIPGHEGAGFVVSVGPGVKHLKEGDRVGMAWLHSACGYCQFCLSGWETLCHAQQNSGYSVNGTFAECALGQADYLGVFRVSSPSPTPARSSAPVSRLIKDSSKPRPAPANGSSSVAWVALAISQSNTRGRWGYASQPSISARKNFSWPESSERKSRSMPRKKTLRA
jgi:hypothetical protein